MTSAPTRATAAAVPLSDNTPSDLPDGVPAHLRTVLRPDPAMRGALERLAGRFTLAAVTSCASSRLVACLEVTELAGLFDADRRSSSEDSVNGAGSAVAAGHPTIGILQFVPDADRAARAEALHDVGVAAVVDSWTDVEELSC